MARTLSAYDRIARDRAVVRPVQVTFTYGLGLTGPMDLSIGDIERMALGTREISADVRCCECSEHVVDCPKIGHLLSEWPAGWSWRDAV
jgi:hypothetical protein